MIIKQNFLEICDDCPHMCTTVDSVAIYANDKIHGIEATVTCTNIQICKRAMEMGSEPVENIIPNEMPGELDVTKICRSTFEQYEPSIFECPKCGRISNLYPKPKYCRHCGIMLRFK